MTRKDTGGQAFPVSDMVDTEYGMTLRDYFAGQAMANPGICTGVELPSKILSWFGDRRSVTREEIIAKQAYSYADAMLEACK